MPHTMVHVSFPAGAHTVNARINLSLLGPDEGKVVVMNIELNGEAALPAETGLSMSQLAYRAVRAAERMVAAERQMDADLLDFSRLI